MAALDQQYRERDLTRTGDGRSEITSLPILADLKRAKAQLDSAQTELDRAQENLNRTNVRAPYDGMIIEKILDVGQVVNTQSILAKIAALDLTQIRLPLSLHDLQYLTMPSGNESMDIPVELSADMGGVTNTWNGRIVRSEGTIDPVSRVINVVAQVVDPYNLKNTHSLPLRIGTYVTAKITGKDAGSLFVLPRHAVTQGSTVWVLNEDNKIYPRDVTIERSDQEFVYISEGFKSGGNSVLRQSNNLYPE